MFNKIIIELYEQKVIKNIINNMNISSRYADDLEQEIYTILLEYDNDKIIELYNKKQLKYFIIGVIQRQYFSNNSPFYKVYKKYYNMEDNEINNIVEKNYND
jgi:hypothetical protein